RQHDAARLRAAEGQQAVRADALSEVAPRRDRSLARPPPARAHVRLHDQTPEAGITTLEQFLASVWWLGQARKVSTTEERGDTKQGFLLSSFPPWWRVSPRPPLPSNRPTGKFESAIASLLVSSAGFDELVSNPLALIFNGDVDPVTA